MYIPDEYPPKPPFAVHFESDVDVPPWAPQTSKKYIPFLKLFHTLNKHRAMNKDIGRKANSDHHLCWFLKIRNEIHWKSRNNFQFECFGKKWSIQKFKASMTYCLSILDFIIKEIEASSMRMMMTKFQEDEINLFYRKCLKLHNLSIIFLYKCHFSTFFCFHLLGINLVKFNAYLSK